MPSELPEPKPKQSEKVKVEEDQESPEEKKEKTYTPPNKLGLPSSPSSSISNLSFLTP